MKITDLTPTLLIRFDIEHSQERGRLIPLRKINYQDIQIGDIMINSDVDWTAIQITGKNIKDTESGRWSLGEELLTYDVYHINDDEVVLEVKGHNFPYQGLVKERWKRLKLTPPPIIALNYPEEILNSRTDN
tara:strand:- start:136 stop:531 length:396 start_codon:yes stop_codon:yes gene_type:complete